MLKKILLLTATTLSIYASHLSNNAILPTARKTAASNKSPATVSAEVDLANATPDELRAHVTRLQNELAESRKYCSEVVEIHNTNAKLWVRDAQELYDLKKSQSAAVNSTAPVLQVPAKGSTAGISSDEQAKKFIAFLDTTLADVYKIVGKRPPSDTDGYASVVLSQEVLADTTRDR